jgi:hypothetical protein
LELASVVLQKLLKCHASSLLERAAYDELLCAFYCVGKHASSGPLIDLGMLPECDRKTFQSDLVKHLLHSSFKVADPLCHKRALALSAKFCEAKLDMLDDETNAILKDLAMLGQCLRDTKTSAAKEALAEAKERLKQTPELKTCWMAYPGLVGLDAAVAMRIKLLSQDFLAVACLTKASTEHPNVVVVSSTSSHNDLLEAVRLWKPWVSKYIEVIANVSADFATSQPDLLASCTKLLKTFQMSVDTRQLYK